MILTANPGLPMTSTSVRYAVIGYDVQVGNWFPLEKWYGGADEERLTHWREHGNMNPRIWTEFKLAKVTDTTVWEAV